MQTIDRLEESATIDLPGSGWPPPPSSRPVPPRPVPPPRRAWRAFFFASVVTAALVGAGAGYLGGALAPDGATTATTVATTTTAAGTATPTTTAAATQPMAVVDGAIDVPAIATRVEPSVVTITTEVTVREGPRTVSGTAAGTGIILTSDGQVLTNAHVVADATSITVTLAGETTARTAVLIGADTTDDVALLQIEGVSGLTPATIGDSEQMVVGDDVVAIGNALDLEGDVSVTRGIISALDRTVDVDSRQMTGMLQTDTAISSGNSGGPLVNSAGEVIGMITAGATSSGSVTAENIGFAIAIDHAMEVVAELRAAA